MSSTDDRIVKMQFDNAAFRKGAADTQKSLADLNKAVDQSGKSKGLLDMSAQMGQVAVSASKMSIITTTALATIANKATNTAIGLAKSLTFDPIKQGFNEYEELLTKQNTIMNATGLSAKRVKGYLNELNTYSDKTIYSFGNMTESITKFVNAGVPLPQAVKSIKGIANAAAFAGASTQDANRAMFAFSQSMSTGFVMLNDWQQIENANMGTIQFKQTLIDTAVEAGTLTKRGKEYVTQSGKTLSATKGWREGLQEQWATTEVLNKSLAKYTDTNTKMGRKAAQSATEVRTFTAFMDTLKESLGSGWSQLFTSLIGNLGQSTKMWTGFSNVIGGAIKSTFNFLAVSLKTWRKMGGFEKVVQGFKNILAPFGALLTAIGDAWREAFPNSGQGAGKALYGLSAGFEAVTRPLQLLADLIGYISSPLAIFFKVLKIGGTIVGRVASTIGDFIADLLHIGELKPSGGGFIQFFKDVARSVSNAIDKIDEMLSKGASIGSAFGSVSMPDLPDMPSMPTLPKMGSVVSGDGGGSKIAALSGGVKDLTKQVFGLKGASDKAGKTEIFNASAKGSTDKMKAVREGLSQFSGGLQTVGSDAKSFGDKVGDAFSFIYGWAKKLIGKVSFEDIVSSANLAILATTLMSASRMMNTFSRSFKGFVGLGENVNGVLEETQKSLKSYQGMMRAKTVLNYALALLALAAALWILSKIPADDLAKALFALGVSMFMLNKGMKTFTKLIETMNKDGMKSSINALAMSVALLALGGAMILFATACLILNKVKWSSIFKGLLVMSVMTTALETLGNLGKGAAGKLMGAAVAYMAVAAAMVVLAGALLLFQLVKWESIGKAGAVLGGLTLAIGLLAMIPYEGIAKVGLALLTASLGMLAIANALIIFALVKWESIGKAAVMLGLLTASLAVLMMVGGPAAASAMIGLAGAFVLLALGCLMLNKVDWESIGKAALVLTVLLAALAVGAVIITLFLYAITPIAPVLIIVAAGFALLGLGLLAFAAAMSIAITLGAAGVAAFAALATGAAVAVAVFMQTLASEAPILKNAFLKILQSLIDTIVEAVPMIIQGVKDLWQAVKKEFTSSDKGAATGKAGQSWVEKAKDGIVKMLPKIVAVSSELITKFIRGLASKAGDIVLAGVDMVIKIAKGIGNRAGDISKAAVDLIVKFAKGIGDNIGKVTDAGIQMIATFLHKLADSIRGGASSIGSGISDVIDAFRDVGVQMIQGMINGIASIDIKGAIENIADSLPGWARKILQIHSPSRVFIEIGKFIAQGLAKGITDHASAAIVSVSSMLTGTIAMANEMVSGYIQRLDQQAIAAQAKAIGLARAAQRAQKEANKTKKTKADDRAADRLSRDARNAKAQSKKAEAKASAAKKAQDRQATWDAANAAERAKIRANDAARNLQAAKDSERAAAAARIEAAALDKQAKAAGVTAGQRKALRKEADRLRKSAKAQAAKANAQFTNAKTAAAAALEWQKKAGEQASASFQDQYDAAAKADADAEAFEKMTAAEKADIRKKQADEMQAKADANLAAAKKLAFTDLEGANALAELALSQAESARELLDESLDFANQGGAGQVVNLAPTEAAALAYQSYADAYSSAMAAAAAGSSVEFNQYNTSPESLSDAEIYRQTNNLFTFAADKVSPSAA